MLSSVASISHAGGTRYKVSGVLDFDSVPGLMREIKKMLQHEISANISFADVKQCNSAGLALLLEVVCFMQGKTVQFTEVPQQMAEIARAYGVTEEFKKQGLIGS